ASPRAAFKQNEAAELVVGSLQSLIDGLQFEREKLARLHDLERQRASFVENFNKQIVASIVGGIAVIEPNGFTVVTNGHARALFGYTNTDHGETDKNTANLTKLRPMREVRYQQFFTNAPRLCELIEACLEDGRTVTLEEFEARRPDGSSCWL